jgi:hypothetical protein
MRRIDLPLKECKNCRALMPRKRYADRLEKPSEYAARECCDSVCRARRHATVLSRRRCRFDGHSLARKRYPSGRIESRNRFYRRVYCNESCRWKHAEATRYERLRRLDERRSWCSSCQSNLARLTSPLCAACGWWQTRSAEQWIARTPGLAGRSERTHRTNLRRMCEHERIRGSCKPCRDVETARIERRLDWRRRRAGRRLSEMLRNDITKFFNYKPQPDYAAADDGRYGL